MRDRLLWALLAESGLRLGEALGLQHRDWHTGCGDTAFIEVVPRDHPHGVRVKGGGYRKLYVSAELDRLYGEYVWQLCEAGADLAAADLDETCVFVNLSREPRFAPWRPESVYDLVRRLRRQLAGQVPAGWTPHWFRHSHASALLLAGVPVHVVSRRLGHADVQTTLNVYGHVTEDAELRAAADWKALTARWLAASPEDEGRGVPVSGGPPGTGPGWAVSYQPGILQGLWEAIPPGMRLAYFSAGTVPEEYRGGLAHQRGRPRASTCRRCPRRSARSWRGACSALSPRAARSTSPT